MLFRVAAGYGLFKIKEFEEVPQVEEAVMDVSGRYSRKDWVMFLKKDLALKARDHVETRVHSITNYLMVKLKTEEQFTSCLNRLRKEVLWIQIKQSVYG